MEQEQGRDVGSLSCDVPVKISLLPQIIPWTLNLPSTDLLEHLSMHFLAKGLQQPGGKESVCISAHHGKSELLQQCCSPWSELSGEEGQTMENQGGGWGHRVVDKDRSQGGKYEGRLAGKGPER